MHVPNPPESDPSNPYIQIMFNINSKKVVNNNIVSNRGKELTFDVRKDNQDERDIREEGKEKIEKKSHKNKIVIAKGNDLIPQKHDNQQESINTKPKKKPPSKQTKSNLSGSQTQRSSKNHKKNISQPFSKLISSQQCQFSQKKAATKSRSKLKSSNHLNSKDTRDKIIELMIRDYERGEITGENLKVAIASLIDKETQQKKAISRPQSRNERPRSRIATSYKNSLAQSLHATPKNKPSKSKSQKFHYHSYQPSMVLKTHKQPNITSEQPQIVQRIIHNKEFMSKIIIKGVNSSLFLSNQWTEKESPSKQTSKREQVTVNVINTSDSVRQLKREMGKFMLKGQVKIGDLNIDQGNYCKNELIGNKLNFQKQKDTKDILANFIEEINSESKNQFISSKYSLYRQKSSNSSQNSLKYLTRLKQGNAPNIIDNQSSQIMDQNSRLQNSLDDFYIREHDNNEMGKNDGLRIEELQKQYALLLKDKQSESRQPSSLPNESVQQYRSSLQRPTQITLNQSQFSPNKIKSYVSSELQSKLQNSSSLSSTQQEVNQKRAKSITQSEIKKLNQIMDVIKDQLNKKEILSTGGTNDEEVLNRIVKLLESEKNKVEKELKIYGQLQNGDGKETKGNIVNSVNSGSAHKRQSSNEERIEQNQIINSFQKKLKKLNIFQSTQRNEPKKIHFQSSQIRSLSSSSRKSITSNNSTHHLQKVKISELNLDEIQIGLKRRLNDLQLQRQQQLSTITEKFINDKISPKQFHEEKEIIQKWFNIQVKELKRTKRNLFQGYKKAKEFLLKEETLYETKLTKEKSTKMIKCISEKYLEKIGIKQEENKILERAGGQIVSKNQNRQKPSSSNARSDKLNQSQTPYQTIQEIQAELLVRNITPIQNFVYLEKYEREVDALSPLSIQQSRISHQQESVTTENNQHDIPQVLMTLQECENSESKGSYNRVIDKEKNQQKAQHSSEGYYEYEQVRAKRPFSASKVHNEIQQYLRKYEEEIEEERKDSKDCNQKEDDSNENNQTEEQELQQLEEERDDNEQNQADVQQSSQEQENQEYYGYNQTEQESIDVDKSFQKFNYHNQQKQQFNQQSLLTSSDVLVPPQQPQHLNIIVNKASLHQDEIFSPKKPSVHEQFSQQLLQYNSTSSSHQKVSLQFTALNQKFNQTFLKLKYLTQQDKDDIFEFMFLDLCLELFLQQTKNNKIMKTIQRYIVFQRRKKKIPKGFKTGLDTCKLYITCIQEYLLKNYFSTLKRLQCPMGPSAKEMLKFMRDYDDTEETDSQVQTVNLVLPIEIYQKFQGQPINKLQVERYYDDDEKQESRLKFLKSLKHFHNKAMFDSLNQMLDVQRCYGIWGKPFPWKKALDVDRKFDDETIKVPLSQKQKKLSHACQKLIENCSYFCGVLIDKEESVFGKTNVSEEYLHHIREDRMFKMLSNDMIDNEDRWIFYDDEETEVLVSISKSITASLISQVLQEMKIIAWK